MWYHFPVVAIVLFGDPSHVVNATYNEGTSENKGVRLTRSPFLSYPSAIH